MSVISVTSSIMLNKGKTSLRFLRALEKLKFIKCYCLNDSEIDKEISSDNL